MKLITHASKPVHHIAEHLHRKLPHLRVSKGVTQVFIGSSIMVFGVYSAHVLEAILPARCQIIVDAVCYGIHGLGSAPIIKVIATKLKIEI